LFILLLFRLAIETIEVGVDGINLADEDVHIFFGEEIVAIATGVEHGTGVLFATIDTGITTIIPLAAALGGRSDVGGKVTPLGVIFLGG
jgi:hypothetical protein